MSTQATKPLVLSDANFFLSIKSESLFGDGLFCARCGPCRSMEPVVEELATEFAGKARFAKVEVDANPITAQQSGIMSILTFLLTNRGKVLDVVIGALPKEEFQKIISQYVEA